VSTVASGVDNSNSMDIVIAKKKKREEKKELAKLKTQKGGLGKNERPGGLKTRKGDPGKNKGHAKENIYSRWIENPKGRFRQKLGIQKKKEKEKKNTLKRKAMTI